MKTLIFSDVHGNLPAFEAMLAEAGQVDGYISLGDIVNYGPWSNECIDLVLSLPNCILIEGNHEVYFKMGAYPGSNGIAKKFFEHCFPRFDRHPQIQKWQSSYEFNGFTCAHTVDERNIYPDTKLILQANYVIGHSHHQFCIRNNGHALYNAGSVGQNRRHINVINFLLFDDNQKEFEERQLQYDITPVISEMRHQGYPDECIAYYADKDQAGGIV